MRFVFIRKNTYGAWGLSSTPKHVSFGFPRNLGLFINPVVNDFESTTGPIGLIVSMPITLLLTTGNVFSTYHYNSYNYNDI